MKGTAQLPPPSGFMCGAPTKTAIWDNWQKIEGTKCRECEKLKNTIRTCLRCDRKFKPGCLVRWTCGPCWQTKSVLKGSPSD